MRRLRFYRPFGPPDSQASGLSDPPIGQTLELDGEQTHHALRVLRVTVGTELELFDGLGGAGQAEVTATAQRSLTLRLRSWRREPEPVHVRWVAAAPPKGARAETMVDQLGQLGVTRFTPLLTRPRRGSTTP